MVPNMPRVLNAHMVPNMPILLRVYLNAWLLFQRLHETKSYSQKEHEVIFLKRQNLIFSIVAGSI